MQHADLPAHPGHRIDVLIPAYNAAATIGEAVASIQAQTIDDIRIHVVDDGSTDNTPAILAAIAREDTRVVIHTRPNGGIVDALNHGLARCTARIIARHDADDLAYPDRFARQLAWLDANPDAIAVGGNVRHIDGAGQPTGTFSKIESPDHADPYAVPTKEPYIVHPFLMAQRAAIDQVGGYRYVYHAEDTDLYWRLQEVGRLHNLPDILGDYRLHDGSISGRSVVNGRIMAVCSQLAGLSARRRRAGRPDISFDKSLLARLQQARALEAMVAIAGEPLDSGERDALEETVAAKLLELAGYRPWEPDTADCRFIRRVVDRGFGHLPPRQRAVLIRQLSGSAARLFHDGLRTEARLLLPPRYYPQGAARLAVRTVRHRVAAAGGRRVAIRIG